jgi:hypothetical protein
LDTALEPQYLQDGLERLDWSFIAFPLLYFPYSLRS